MDDLKSLDLIFKNKKRKQEVYKTDEYKRYYRGQKGIYSKDPTVFNFIHLIKMWPDFLKNSKPYLKENTCPLKIQDGILFVITRHQVFSTELSYMGPELLARVQNAFPSLHKTLHKIKFMTKEDFFELRDKVVHENKAQEKRELHPFSPEYQKLKRKAQALFEEGEEIEEDVSELFFKLLTEINHS